VADYSRGRGSVLRPEGFKGWITVRTVVPGPGREAAASGGAGADTSDSRRRRVFALLRAKPEILFVPFATFFLLVNVAPWGFGSRYLLVFYQAFTLQRTNVIFPFTYGYAVACFVALMWGGLRWTRIGFVRTFLVAGTVPFAGPGLFEFLFQEAGHYIHPGLFIGYAVPYVMFSYGVTWVTLGLTGLAWWRITWRWWIVFGYSVGGFVLWIALGFPLVNTGTFAQLPAAYILNISLKGTFYLMFFLPIFEGMYLCRGRPADSTKEVSYMRKKCVSNVQPTEGPSAEFATDVTPASTPLSPAPRNQTVARAPSEGSSHRSI
jgi:hypothetical protein